MSSFDFFDRDDEIQVHANARPIWTIGDLDDNENETQVLKWLNAEIDFLRQENRDRTDEVRKHYQLYKGLSLERIARSDERDRLVDRNRVQRKVVINHLYDLTEQRVARFVKFKPSVAILPTNDEFSDKQASKLAKRIFDHIKYIQRYDLKNQDAVRIKEIAGESYLFIEWNADLGPEHPASKRARENGEKVPLLDVNGEPELGEDGKPIMIEDKVCIGDVEMSVVRPENMLFQRIKEPEMVEYCFRIRYDLVDNLKLKYPEKAHKIKANTDPNHFDFTQPKDERGLKSRTIYFEFWHKGTDGIPDGRHIIFTPDTILKNTMNPYTHKEFPFECLKSIQIPGEMHARSFYINARQIATQINNLTTMVLRNQKMASAPKWMVPRGAVKLEQLHNDISIVQYQGPVAPQLAQSNPTPLEIFNFRQQMKEDLQQISGITGVSRGEPPPGIKAGIALQFLNEQENNRFNGEISQYNEFQRRVAIKTLSVVGDYYENDDERTIDIVGKHDEFTRVGVDVTKLSKPFDVRIQNSSALPESKAARIQTLLDLSERFPEAVPQEVLIDLIDFGQSEKYIDEAAAAVRAAEVEVEKQNEGETIDPERYEFHIQHWGIHVTDIQKPGFRGLPKKIQQLKKDHIMAHEMHMLEVAKDNPTYLERLRVLRQFPLFFKPDTSAPQPEVRPDQEVAADIDSRVQQSQEQQFVQDRAQQAVGEAIENEAPPLQPGGEAVVNPQAPLQPNAEI